jgi:hypothetical protein
MKVIDKTPLQNEKGEISLVQRVQGTLEHGFQWYPELEAQKVVIAQLERVLEKGFTLIRNMPLGKSSITEPLILVGQPGVYVLYVTPATGLYEAKGEEWNQIKSGHPYPAEPNLMMRVERLARALQVYLQRQSITLPGPVEPVLVASSPAMHIDSVRPMVRVVLSDAVRQFAASLLQARPILRPDQIVEVADHIVTPRIKPVSLEAEEPKTNEYYLPPGLRDEGAEQGEQQPAPQAEPPSRARAIFHAAEEAKPFDPADLEFAFDENAEENVPEDLKETSPSQQIKPRVQRPAFSRRQWVLLGGMLVVECCVLAGFAYAIITGIR